MDANPRKGTRFRDLLDRVTAIATGRGQMDLAALLTDHARRAEVEGSAGPTIPNLFGVAQGEPSSHPDTEMLERHLADVIADTAVQRGWRLDGPVRVTLTPGGRTPRIESGFEPGELPAWSVLTSTVDDGPLPVRPNRAVVGRSRDVDVVISGTGVSRRHALLWREIGRVWIADLQSSNGTLVNGDPVYDVVEIRRADVISFGEASFVFGMA